MSLSVSLTLSVSSTVCCAVWLVQCLQCGDQDTLVKALKRPPESSLKREGLRAVSLLLRDPRGKVCSAASSLLRSLADQPRHRERVNQLILPIAVQHFKNTSSLFYVQRLFCVFLYFLCLYHNGTELLVIRIRLGIIKVSIHLSK